MTANVLRVQAKPGLLIPEARRPRQGGLSFIGWRECGRGADGNYNEASEHEISPAPGVDEKTGTGGNGDLFIRGFEHHLTRMDAETSKPIVVSIVKNPSDPLYVLALRGIADGELEQVTE